MAGRTSSPTVCYAASSVKIEFSINNALHEDTHFILVDNGSEGRYGTEIELRARLEAQLGRDSTSDGTIF